MAAATTVGDLREIFLRALLRDVGGSRSRWRVLLGDVRIYAVETHPHCNWAVTPSGSFDEIAAIERLADELRQRYPVVAE